MELKQLRYFTEVVKQGSFTKASATLFTSQPSVSNAVKELEKELGEELLVRHSRKVELTDAGRLLFNYYQEIKNTLDRFNDELSALKINKKGSVKMGSTSTLGSHFFAEVIGEFRTSYPDISVNFVEDGAYSLKKSLLSDELDVAIMHTPVDENLFHYFTFLKGDLRLIVPENHPLSTRASVIWEDVKEEDFILLPQGYKMHEMIVSECHKHGFCPKVICETSHWDFIIKMVENEQGITILPHYENQSLDLEKHHLRIIPFESPVEWELGIGWRKKSYQSFATKLWVDFLRDKL